MAKIVSVVPKLLTNTLGLTAEAPKPIVIETPTPAPTTLADTDKKPDESISGPDLSDDLNSIGQRNRGRTGTISTSFRGVLTDSSATLPRRTLLGE